jgi:hypothetical protein
MRLNLFLNTCYPYEKPDDLNFKHTLLSASNKQIFDDSSRFIIANLMGYGINPPEFNIEPSSFSVKTFELELFCDSFETVSSDEEMKVQVVRCYTSEEDIPKFSLNSSAIKLFYHQVCNLLLSQFESYIDKHNICLKDLLAYPTLCKILGFPLFGPSI